MHLENFNKVSSIDEVNTETISKCFFFLFFHSDDEYLYHINVIHKYGGKIIPDMLCSKWSYVHANKHTRYALMDTLKRNNSITHYNEVIHGNICQAIEQTKHLEGDYVEIGVFKGGSALTALNYMKHSNINRNTYLLDTYDGFNYDEASKSCDIYWNGTHKLWEANETMNYIQTLLKEECPLQHFQLIKSNICKDALTSQINKIVVANIDVDMLEATYSALEKVAEKIVVGGIIIAEDPTATPLLMGSFFAMESFLNTEIGKKFMKLHLGGQYFLIKLK
jgi:hypothetical protein